MMYPQLARYLLPAISMGRKKPAKQSAATEFQQPRLPAIGRKAKPLKDISELRL